MDIMMESMERWMERLIVDQNPSPIRNQDFKGSLRVEKTQIAPKKMQEHRNPSLLVEEGGDEQLRSPFPPNPAFHEEYN